MAPRVVNVPTALSKIASSSLLAHLTLKLHECDEDLDQLGLTRSIFCAYYTVFVMLIFIGFILATLQSVLVPFDFADPANVLHSCSIFFYGLTKLVTIGCLCASRKLSLHGALLVTSLVSAMLKGLHFFFVFSWFC